MLPAIVSEMGPPAPPLPERMEKYTAASGILTGALDRAGGGKTCRVRLLITCGTIANGYISGAAQVVVR